MYRLTYASTATSKPNTLRDDLTSILEEARKFNFNHEVHGVLLYSNNYFYQCIEGPKTTIDGLFQRLIKDQRHNNISKLSYSPTERTIFAAWQMKYILLNEPIKQFLLSKGMDKFDPYRINKEFELQFLDLLALNNESIPGQNETVHSAGSFQSYKFSYFIVFCLIAIILLAIIYWLIK